MADRLVFITGASSGIGHALSTRFHAAGYRLALVARRSDEVTRWIAEAGIDAARVAIYIDVVIANAGISVGIDTAELADLELMRAIYETNNLGMAATFHPFVAAMRERRSGTLVGVASVAGIRGLPGHGGYCSSKAAVITYCESLRGELRPFGIRVVTIVPGYVDTPLTRGNRYAMPFLMSAADFADRAWRGIEAGASWRVIPWQMGVVARLLRLVPNALFDRLVAGRPRKHRKQQ
jgi:hypothetical protein